MSTTTRTCITVACDECNESFESWDGMLWHWDELGDAMAAAGGEGWFIRTDGSALCPSSGHEAFARGLLATLSEPERGNLLSVRPYLEADDEDEPTRAPHDPATCGPCGDHADGTVQADRDEHALDGGR